MIQEEREQYLDELMKQKGKGLGGSELRAYQKGQAALAQMNQLTQNIQQLRQQVANATTALNQQQGIMAAHSETLCEGEEARRAATAKAAKTAEPAADVARELTDDWTPDEPPAAPTDVVAAPETTEPPAQQAAN